MTYWQDFLNSLDTPGGHIVVAGVLLGVSTHIGNMELSMIAIGILARGLGSAQRKDPA